MLYREIIAVCSEIHTKHIHTLCGQNLGLLNVKLVIRIVNTGLKSVIANIFEEGISRQQTNWASENYDFCKVNPSTYVTPHAPRNFVVFHNMFRHFFMDGLSTVLQLWNVFLILAHLQFRTEKRYIHPINTADTEGDNFRSKSVCTQRQARPAVQQCDLSSKAQYTHCFLMCNIRPSSDPHWSPYIPPV